MSRDGFSVAGGRVPRRAVFYCVLPPHSAARCSLLCLPPHIRRRAVLYGVLPPSPHSAECCVFFSLPSPHSAAKMCARRRSEGRARRRSALLLQGHNTPVRNDPLRGAAVRCAFSHGRASSRQGHAIVGFAAEVQRSFQQRTGCLLSRKYPCRVRGGGLFFLLQRSAPVEGSRERTEKRRCRAATVGRTFEQRRLFGCGRSAAAASCSLPCSAPHIRRRKCARGREVRGMRGGEVRAGVRGGEVRGGEVRGGVLCFTVFRPFRRGSVPLLCPPPPPRCGRVRAENRQM